MDELGISFAQMWVDSRHKAGKSQQYMADSLGVNKQTIQNWEAGYSCPSQLKGFEWFKALDLSPIPYYLKLFYPEIDISDSEDDEAITSMLMACILSATPSQRKRMLYILTGDHGSSVAGVLEMVTAHLQCPLQDRLNIAGAVLNNYEVAEALGTLHPSDTKPNIDLLLNAFQKGKNSVKEGKKSYTII